MKINVGTFLEAEDQCAFPSVQSEGTGKKKHILNSVWGFWRVSFILYSVQGRL